MCAAHVGTGANFASVAKQDLWLGLAWLALGLAWVGLCHTMPCSRSFVHAPVIFPFVRVCVHVRRHRDVLCDVQVGEAPSLEVRDRLEVGGSLKDTFQDFRSLPFPATLHFYREKDQQR